MTTTAELIIAVDAAFASVERELGLAAGPPLAQIASLTIKRALEAIDARLGAIDAAIPAQLPRDAIQALLEEIRAKLDARPSPPAPPVEVAGTAYAGVSALANLNRSPVWRQIVGQLVEGTPSVIRILDFVSDPDGDALAILLDSATRDLAELGAFWDPASAALRYDGRKGIAGLFSDVVFSADDRR